MCEEILVSSGESSLEGGSIPTGQDGYLAFHRLGRDRTGSREIKRRSSSRIYAASCYADRSPPRTDRRIKPGVASRAREYARNYVRDCFLRHARGEANADECPDNVNRKGADAFADVVSKCSSESLE